METVTFKRFSPHIFPAVFLIFPTRFYSLYFFTLGFSHCVVFPLCHSHCIFPTMSFPLYFFPLCYSHCIFFPLCYSPFHFFPLCYSPFIFSHYVFPTAYLKGKTFSHSEFLRQLRRKGPPGRIATIANIQNKWKRRHGGITSNVR